MLRPARPALTLLALAALWGGAAALAGCGGDGRGAYVGTWRPAGADTLGSRMTLLGDGTARFVERPPVGEPQSFEARYEVAGDSVLTLSDAQGAERFRVRLDGDTLRLQSLAGGAETVRVRL
ncbi:hypothetical protein RQM47_00455 [Rubrivirga sp. S365]|uniref:DUF5640 domain-containing protein n=1 Tax=Rubrivirga litoralis TaxID=3075598 RepID=A0ABU3BU73_9BACT|nr:MULTISPECIES: hypothetical protein [unclassified Rubrivirga]MDT0632828.1 hypothetical protein [Rubrivirga sp. F394]MDT7855106.1 hypothetical protein [Rubrivirga sp. S365]